MENPQVFDVFSILDSLLEQQSVEQIKQIRDVVPVSHWLSSEFYSGEDGKDLYPKWKDVIVEAIEGQYSDIVLTGCGVGSTKVVLLDGTIKSLKELSHLFPTKKDKFWVYACTKKGTLAPGKASFVRKTGENREVWKIKLDNGLEEFFTPDHLFLMDNGSYKRVKYLQSNDVLMPFNYSGKCLQCKVISAEFSHYEDVYDMHVDVFHNYGLSSGIFVHNSLGSGKSTCADFLILRKLYELSCFDPIPSLFNLMVSSTIFFIYFSISLKQAELTGFGKVRRLIDNTPYFQKYFPRNKQKNSVLEFRNVSLTYGSSIGHQLGMDLMGSILDEANFMGKDVSSIEQFDKAAKLHDAITNRRLNRFVVKGEDKGLSITVSSADEPTSFAESKIKEAKTNPNIYVARVAAYEVKRSHYSKEEFLVFTGNDLCDPLIIDRQEDLLNATEALAIDSNSLDWSLHPHRIVKTLDLEYQLYFHFVPETFRNSFESNIIKAIQEIIGKSATPDYKLFKSKEQYNDAIIIDWRSPFSKDEIILSTDDDVMLSSYFDISKLKYINRKRAIHVDLSVSKDRTGIAMAYISNYEKRDELYLPIVALDFIVAITPPKKPHEIPIAKIREFILWLRNQNVNLASVTYDRFQSKESLQILKQNGLNAFIYSPDNLSRNTIKKRANDEDWLALSNLYFERRLKHPHSEIYRTELFGLDHDKTLRRVDHPRQGSKDVADGVVGAVTQILMVSDIATHNLTQLASEEFDTFENIYQLMLQNKMPLE